MFAEMLSKINIFFAENKIDSIIFIRSINTFIYNFCFLMRYL